MNSTGQPGAERDNDLRVCDGRDSLALTPNAHRDSTAGRAHTTGRTNIGLEAGGGTGWTSCLATPKNLGTDKRGFHSGPPEADDRGRQSFQDIDRFTGSVVVNNHCPTSSA